MQTSEKGIGMPLIIGLVAIILVAGVAGFFVLQKNQSSTPSDTQTETTSSPINTQTTPNAEATQGALTEQGTTQGQVQVFDVEARNFKFSVPEMRVKKGDTVTVNLKVVEGFHNWDLEEFEAETKQMAAGNSDSVTFVADKVGIFEYYCAVGNHRKMGMVGKLIVE